MDQRQLSIVLKLQDEASRELKKLSGELNNAEANTSRWGGALNYVAGAAKYAAAAIGAAAVAGVTWGINVAAQLETAQVGLTTLLGSSEKAAATVARLKKEAARTPFELPGLTQAVQLLTSVTKDGDKSIDIIMNIGEGLAAMGKGQTELDRIIVNLQQIASLGRANTIDIKQFAFAGIPIYEMLAETTGKTGQALADLIENGGVTFDLLTKMFDQANDAGGRFFNAYVNQSGTFNQAMSNMKDSIGIFLADLVKETGIFGGLTEAMTQASNWLGNYKANLEGMRQTIIDWINLIDEKTGLITMLKDAWANLVMVYQDQLAPALAQLWATLQPLKPYLEAMAQVFGTMLVIAIGALIMILGALAAGLIQALTYATQFVNFIMGKWLTAVNMVRDAIATLITTVETLIEKFKSAFEWAGKVASKAGGSISGAVGKAINFVTGKADGGPVTGGTPYIVGEQGPELFVPRSNGSIIPNGMMGGISIIINGDVSGRELVEKVTQAIAGNLKSRARFA